MYNGVGLLSVRGAGTSGHVRRNAAAVKRPRSHSQQYASSARQQLAAVGAPALVVHQRRRQIELEVVQEDERLREQRLSSPEIASRTAALREQLLNHVPSVADASDGHDLNAELVPRVADVSGIPQIDNDQRKERLREALKIPNTYEEGSAFRGMRNPDEANATERNAVDEARVAAKEVKDEKQNGLESASSSSLLSQSSALSSSSQSSSLSPSSSPSSSLSASSRAESPLLARSASSLPENSKRPSSIGIKNLSASQSGLARYSQSSPRGDHPITAYSASETSHESSSVVLSPTNPRKRYRSRSQSFSPSLRRVRYRSHGPTDQSPANNRNSRNFSRAHSPPRQSYRSSSSSFSPRPSSNCRSRRHPQSPSPPRGLPYHHRQDNLRYHASRSISPPQRTSLDRSRSRYRRNGDILPTYARSPPYRPSSPTSRYPISPSSSESPSSRFSRYFSPQCQDQVRSPTYRGSREYSRSRRFRTRTPPRYSAGRRYLNHSRYQSRRSPSRSISPLCRDREQIETVGKFARRHEYSPELVSRRRIESTISKSETRDMNSRSASRSRHRPDWAGHEIYRYPSNYKHHTLQRGRDSASLSPEGLSPCQEFRDESKTKTAAVPPRHTSSRGGTRIYRSPSSESDSRGRSRNSGDLNRGVV